MNLNYIGYNDRKLSRLASGQDKRAFDVLIERHRGYIMTICYKYADSIHEAEDSFQKASLKAWKAFPDFRGDCAFKTWMYKIVRNINFDYSTWKARRSEVSFDRLFESGFDIMAERANRPDIVLETKDGNKCLGKRLERVLSRLPLEHGECLRLVSEGMSYREISKIQKVPVGTVMSRIFYGRKMAAKYYKRVKSV